MVRESFVFSASVFLVTFEFVSTVGYWARRGGLASLTSIMLYGSASRTNGACGLRTTYVMVFR